MKVDVLLGLQWGDEGKGKIVDVLTPHYDIIARFQGGPNAGHTLEFDGQKIVLNTIPSGIFREGKINLIGNGVIIDPVILLYKEIAQISKLVDVKSRLYISKKSHLILPTHRLMDYVNENVRGAAKIGSTLKGIGPTYTDKIARNGVRMGDVLEPNFKEKYEALKQQHLDRIKSMGFDEAALQLDGSPWREYEHRWFQALEELKTYHLVNSEYFLNDALAQGKKVLAEGAQGSLLDIDFGSYPFVTSSNTITAGVCSGLGIAPHKVGKVYGIFKAYCTRVGAGPFPTELDNEIGETMRQLGHEFGATTGRSRRCGWLDLPMLRYSCMLNGVTDLIMMKGDVLNGFEKLMVCTDYKLADGTITREIPFDFMTKVTPIYKEMQGWHADINANNIPKLFMDYKDFVEQYIQTPICMISYGPDRNETIEIEHK